MAINVALALNNVDFNNINITFVDGLSIDKLKIRYNWIFNAIIQDAILGEDAYGLVWYSGTWVNGEWYDGTWYSGIFKEGIWKNGNFYSYKLNKYDIVNGNFNIINKDDTNSKFEKVIWENGNFYGGIFGKENIFWDNYQITYDPNNPFENNAITLNTMETCVWKNGNFESGTIFNSIWYYGNFKNGKCVNNIWFNGNFYNGIFDGYYWYNGIFLGGDFISGTWYDGTFTTYNTETKSRFGSTINKNLNSSSPTFVSGNTEWCTPTNYYQWSTGLTWDETDMLNKIQNPLYSPIYTEFQTIYNQQNVGTKFLTLNTFNINVPAEAIITGIEVRLSLYRDKIGVGTIKDITVSISDLNENIVYENKATNTTLDIPQLYVGEDVYDWEYYYGGEYQMWGKEWTIDDVNSDNFNLSIKLSLLKDVLTDNIRAIFAGAQVKIHYQYPKYTYDYTKCTWENGVFNNGEFHSGLYTDENGNIIASENNNISLWKNGVFNNGKFYGGKFLNGTWNNGEFHGGFFGTITNAPDWKNGIFYNGYWVNGQFYDGEFHGGLAKQINIYGGKIGD